MTLEEWIELGEQNGWRIVRFCAAHDIPFPRREAAAFEKGEDPCIGALRVIEE